MIFRQEMIDRIIAGDKTMTRRRSDRYRVGRVYALQPGRGKRGVGHIQILEKRRERLGQITTLDAIAEGFDSRARFMDYWASVRGGVDPALPVVVYGFRLVA